jgi:type II secretory pathway pseudopilin PulG
MKFSILNFNFSLKSFTLIEVLVGTFLILVVFLGIFGAFQLGLKVVSQSKAKIIATALALSQIETIRNLPYSSVGTKDASLPRAVGILDSSTTTVKNNIEFTIETQVEYILDETDGTIGTDTCYLDYKKAEVKVSWSSQFSGEVKLVTDIAPKNKVEEINTCEAQPSGLLSVSVFDAFGAMINSPLIEVFDPETEEKIASYFPLTGKQDIPLAPTTYKVVVSKNGYSSERTFGAGENYNGKIITNPEKSHPIIFEGQITEMSFSIDKVSTFSVNTLSAWGEDYFSDSFFDETKISESSDIIIEEGTIKLIKLDGQFSPEGYIISQTIEPVEAIGWEELNYSDDVPSGTKIRYQVLYLDGENWILVPDTDLPGNSAGLSPVPIDLDRLDISTYPKIRLKATLYSLGSQETTPTLYDWQTSWVASISISNMTFHLQGAKTVGTDAEENQIYKYSTDFVSNSNGHVDIPDLEWDFYTFTINPSTGLDLVRTDPGPQPINLPPDTNLAIKLYLKAENSLLVTIQDIETLGPIFGASVKLYNTGLSYDKTQYTNEKGQTYFIPLENTDYNLEVQASGYSPVSTVISVLGDGAKIIKIQEME